ncbi:Type 4 prepilin-like proteins leader peptide-processing enzyme [compost metagenome]
MLIVAIVSRGGMGLGDVKLLFLLGWVLGLYNVIPAFIISCLVGSVAGGILLLLKVVKPKQAIPFGPFLLIGALVSFAYGTEIINVYLSIFK